MNKFKQLFYKITGGRPMKFIRNSFIDDITKKYVSVYEDKFGRQWLCDSGPWSYFRVSIDNLKD